PQQLLRRDGAEAAGEEAARQRRIGPLEPHKDHRIVAGAVGDVKERRVALDQRVALVDAVEVDDERVHLGPYPGEEVPPDEVGRAAMAHAESRAGEGERDGVDLGAGDAHAAVQPPSTERSAPLIDLAVSVVRNSASAATSSSVTNSLVGCGPRITSRFTSSAVLLCFFMWSGIWRSTSGVQT